MLVRADFHRILMRDHDGAVMRHVRRAFRIREKFIGIPLPGTDKVLLPNCHEVARAYARAFEVAFEDGLVAFVSAAECNGSDTYFLNSLQVHSWNVITVDHDSKVILDVFPDLGLSMMPVVHPYPHPAYLVSAAADESLDGLYETIRRPHFDVAVELLADEFRRLEPAY